MHILVIGGAGMVGRKFIERLARDGGLGGKAIDKVTAQDVFPAEALGLPGLTTIEGKRMPTPSTKPRRE